MQQSLLAKEIQSTSSKIWCLANYNLAQEGLSYGRQIKSEGSDQSPSFALGFGHTYSPDLWYFSPRHLGQTTWFTGCKCKWFPASHDKCTISFLVSKFGQKWFKIDRDMDKRRLLLKMDVFLRIDNTQPVQKMEDINSGKQENCFHAKIQKRFARWTCNLCAHTVFTYMDSIRPTPFRVRDQNIDRDQKSMNNARNIDFGAKLWLRKLSAVKSWNDKVSLFFKYGPSKGLKIPKTVSTVTFHR